MDSYDEEEDTMHSDSGAEFESAMDTDFEDHVPRMNLMNMFDRIDEEIDGIFPRNNNNNNNNEHEANNTDTSNNGENDATDDNENGTENQDSNVNGRGNRVRDLMNMFDGIDGDSVDVAVNEQNNTGNSNLRNDNSTSPSGAGMDALIAMNRVADRLAEQAARVERSESSDSSDGSDTIDSEDDSDESTDYSTDSDLRSNSSSSDDDDEDSSESYLFSSTDDEDDEEDLELDMEQGGLFSAISGMPSENSRYVVQGIPAMGRLVRMAKKEIKLMETIQNSESKLCKDVSAPSSASPVEMFNMNSSSLKPQPMTNTVDKSYLGDLSESVINFDTPIGSSRLARLMWLYQYATKVEQTSFRSFSLMLLNHPAFRMRFAYELVFQLPMFYAHVAHSLIPQNCSLLELNVQMFTTISVVQPLLTEMKLGDVVLSSIVTSFRTQERMKKVYKTAKDNVLMKLPTWCLSDISSMSEVEGISSSLRGPDLIKNVLTYAQAMNNLQPLVRRKQNENIVAFDRNEWRMMHQVHRIFMGVLTDFMNVALGQDMEFDEIREMLSQLKTILKNNCPTTLPSHDGPKSIFHNTARMTMMIIDKLSATYPEVFLTLDDDGKHDVKAILERCMPDIMENLSIGVQCLGGAWVRNGRSPVEAANTLLNPTRHGFLMDILGVSALTSEYGDKDYVIQTLESLVNCNYKQNNLQKILLLMIHQALTLPQISTIDRTELLDMTIIHCLTAQPAQFAEVAKTINDIYVFEDIEEEELEEALERVSTIRHGDGYTPDMFVLKPEFFERYDPTFFLIDRQEHVKIREHMLEKKKADYAEKSIPLVPSLLDIHSVFGTCRAALISKGTLMHVSSLIKNFVTQEQSESDNTRINEDTVYYCVCLLTSAVHWVGDDEDNMTEFKLHFESLKLNELLFTIINGSETSREVADDVKSGAKWVMDHMDYSYQTITDPSIPATPQRDLASEFKSKQQQMLDSLANKADEFADWMDELSSDEDGEEDANNDSPSSNDTNTNEEDMDVTGTPTDKIDGKEEEDIDICIFCHEKLTSQKLSVRMGYLQKTRVPSRCGITCLKEGLAVIGCGHTAHMECHVNYMLQETLRLENNPHEGRRARLLYDWNEGEFACPLCKGLCSSGIPAITPSTPLLASPSEQPSNFKEWFEHRALELAVIEHEPRVVKTLPSEALMLSGLIRMHYDMDAGRGDRYDVKLDSLFLRRQNNEMLNSYVEFLEDTLSATFGMPLIDEDTEKMTDAQVSSLAKELVHASRTWSHASKYLQSVMIQDDELENHKCFPLDNLTNGHQTLFHSRLAMMLLSCYDDVDASPLAGMVLGYQVLRLMRKTDTVKDEDSTRSKRMLDLLLADDKSLDESIDFNGCLLSNQWIWLLSVLVGMNVRPIELLQEEITLAFKSPALTLAELFEKSNTHLGINLKEVITLLLSTNQINNGGDDKIVDGEPNSEVNHERLPFKGYTPPKRVDEFAMELATHKCPFSGKNRETAVCLGCGAKMCIFCEDCNRGEMNAPGLLTNHARTCNSGSAVFIAEHGVYVIHNGRSHETVRIKRGKENFLFF
eukprot:TRINITY_DN328_c3_g1_i1.p1 TRINITY_DN328_c3_g1~~TRINITY_DN328_c3_g1_i1.p1  ORF type:complete len:1713 (-),score=637.73 TRINITY_DN328_c3_g1_i1:31-4719(-)